jgi:hypothetical protein
MKRLGRFLRLPFSDARLLAESLFVLTFVRIGLSVLRFQTLRGVLKKLSEGGKHQPYPERRVVKRVVWSINKISTHIPLFRNCLNRALATQVLLGRRGQEVDLRIGVANDPGGNFRAHAWIESEGRIVLGGMDDLWQLTPLPTLKLRDLQP